MKVFDSDYSLHKIEVLLEEKMEEAYRIKQEEESKIIDSFNLSYEDYCYLILKLKGMTAYGKTLELIQRYKISLITALVYSIRYGTKENVYKKVKMFIKKMPQHQLRYALDMFGDVVEEYAIYNYEQYKGHLDYLFEALAIQAGEDTTYYMSYVG